MRSQSHPRLRGIILPSLYHRSAHLLHCRPKVDAALVIQERLRALAATREAQESENRRRIAWEQELEAKYQHRQAETESQLAVMKRQIAYLKACVASLLRRREDTGPIAGGSGYLFDEPNSMPLVMLPATGLENPTPFVSHENTISEPSQKHGMSVDAPSPSASPGPSHRKRPTPTLNHGDSDPGDSGSEVSMSSSGQRPPKRINNHDKTCYTIQVF
jgi:hypothetical protein